ncbi:MHYT domain-containing protein [Streptomyces sp. NPDC048669]|uniref:MHYT domain-containing protein n=1 Tax=Streptomyces sp. NPDC048669 TaxID=3155267 RepID=UPI00341C16B0
MDATVTDFHYGAVTPVAAYLMACLGSALGLRCTVRSMRRGSRRQKNGWLSLAAVSLGCGIWTMHFIAMMGFRADGSDISYDTRLTLLSLAVAVAVTALGVFLVGHLGSGAKVLATAGLLMGLGVAAMHYIGMSAMQVHGGMRYDTMTVALSVLIAVVAATAALWAAVTVRNLWSSLGASLVMGVAVSGMHYTGMAAVSVHVDPTGATSVQSSIDQLSFLLAMIAGPVVMLIVAATIVMFDPDLVLGDEARPASRRHAARSSTPTATGQRGPHGQYYEDTRPESR